MGRFARSRTLREGCAAQKYPTEEDAERGIAHHGIGFIPAGSET